MKKSSKIILSIFTPIIALLVVCFALAFSSPKSSAVAAIDNGGGFYVAEGSTFNLSKGAIKGNNSKTGGGVYVNKATFNMTGGTISGNTATTDGGGVCLIQSEMTMSAGEISGNTATSGGGVYLGNSTFVMTGGTITNNTAGWGSAIYMYYDSTLELRGGTINGIVTGDRDGGVVNYYDCTFTGGYIEIDGIYDLVICKAPTKDIPVRTYSGARDGTIIARLADGVTATDAILSHLKVQNMPANTELVIEDNNIVIRYIQRTVRLTVNNSAYGSIDQTTLTVNQGTTWSYSNNILTIGTTKITATPAAQTVQYSYAFSQWFNITDAETLATSGTVTSDMEIRVVFTRTTRNYNIYFRVSSSYGYGTVSSTTGVSCAYGTTISLSSSSVMIGSVTRTAIPNDPDDVYSSYGFVGWSTSSSSNSIITTKTVTGTTYLYAVFNRTARTSYSVSFAVDNSAYGSWSSTAGVAVKAGSTYSYNGSNRTLSLYTPVSKTLITTRTVNPLAATSSYFYYAASSITAKTSSASNTSSSGTITTSTTLTALMYRTTSIYMNVSASGNFPYSSISGYNIETTTSMSSGSRTIYIPKGCVATFTSSYPYYIQFTYSGIVILKVQVIQGPTVKGWRINGGTFSSGTTINSSGSLMPTS